MHKAFAFVVSGSLAIAVSSCGDNITSLECGDGDLAVDEACDDGNAVDGDGCDSDCTITACGNHIATVGEVCDDGNVVDGDGCDSDCTITACGNGIATVGEVCDDGNTVEGDGCDSNCALTACGNGIVTVGEVCDDGNAVNGDGCDVNCTIPACGNGVVGADEGCDDANLTNGDGCNNNCSVGLFAYVKAPAPDRLNQFGRHLAVSGDGSTLAVTSETFFVKDNTVDVYRRNGGTWIHETTLVGVDPTNPIDTNEGFGASVALSMDGSTLAVGADRSDRGPSPLQDVGAIHVFTRSGTTWSEQAYVTATTPAPFDRFGHSVALSGDGSMLAVGADGDRGATGAAYVFTRSGTTWSQQANPKASNAQRSDYFGTSVALSADGSTLAVGAIAEDSATTGVGGDQGNEAAPFAGAVYVFARSGATWSQQAYVKASDTSQFDEFGHSVALSRDGSTLSVGVPLHGLDGAVYVFTRGGVTWSQQGYLEASNASVSAMANNFGDAVALSASGNTLVAGAPYDNSAAIGVGGDDTDQSAPGAGAVFEFIREGATWTQRAYVKASNAEAQDELGHAVALSDDGLTLAASAINESSGAGGINGDQTDNSRPKSGAVYLYF